MRDEPASELPGPVARVEGTQDFLEADLDRLRAIQRVMESVFARGGYGKIDTPILEPAELYLRKSGGELASRLYTLADPGGQRLALRPEFTASVIRVFVAGQGRFPRPKRWQYAGPVFRYEPLGQGLRQFTQGGAELIGASGPEADAEVVSLANAALSELGLGQHRFILGHLGVLADLLGATAISERARHFLLSHLSRLSSEGAAQQVKDALLERASGHPSLPSDLGEDELKTLLADLVGGGGEPVVGSRSVEEIAQRYYRKMQGADPPERLERAWGFLRELTQLKGEPSEVLDQAEALVREHHLDPAPLEEIRELVAALSQRKLSTPVTLDLGLARGLAYYTGMTFEIHHPALSGEPRLCGGGRYDGLVRALGGNDVPALGFAFGLERVAEALQAEGVAL